MLKKARKTIALRKNALHVDASVRHARREIARVFGLPEGCVHLALPSGRRARDDKSIGRLRAAWPAA